MGGSSDVFLAGAISGIVEGLCVQPLEMLKTRAQINEGAPLRLVPAVREIISEGGVLHLYRGGLPEIMGLIPRATAALSTLEFSQRLFRSWHGGELPTAYAYLSGACSGVTEAVAFSPFQVIKVRLMAKEHLGRYRNTLDCLQKGTVFELDKRMAPMQSGVLEAGRTIFVGTGVGILATCFNVPFDVIKSRAQSQLPGQTKYTGVLSTLRSIYREEGASALFKGFVPKALRLGLGQTIGLMTFKQFLKFTGATDPQTRQGKGNSEG